MILTKLDVSSFRNIENVSFEPHSSLNLITGKNGAGKSSILESIQSLSTGRSFRTFKSKELIQHGLESFAVTALFHDPVTSRDHRAGLQKKRDGSSELRLDFEPIGSISEITRLLPVKSLTPDSHKLIQDGPDERRQFLDWGVFHVEPLFFDVWRQFKRSLSQRNQLLRENSNAKEIESWNVVYLESALALDRYRRDYVVLLAEALNKRMATLESTFHVELSYRQGWSQDFDLSELLVRNLDYHRRMKTTTDGPHRSDMVVSTDKIPAKQVLSRGQQKVLVYLLHLSQLDLLREKQSRQAVVLCDDLTSELDTEHSQKLVQQLVDLNSQIFISGVELSVLEGQKHERIHMINGESQKVV